MFVQVVAKLTGLLGQGAFGDASPLSRWNCDILLAHLMSKAFKSREARLALGFFVEGQYPHVAQLLGQQ